MIVNLPVLWRGRAVLHGARSARSHLFREIVPVAVPDLGAGDTDEVCRMAADWAEAAGTTISIHHHEGRFLRPSWSYGSRRMMTREDLVESFRAGELHRHWTASEDSYGRYGDKVANPDAPLPPDAPVRKWESDDRLERIAKATRWIAERCTLVDGIVHAECCEPVLLATARVPGADLDTFAQNDGALVKVSTERRISSAFYGDHPRSNVADIFRLDREEDAVLHASSRWNVGADLVSRVQGLEVLRPDLLTWRDEEMALAAAAGDAFTKLGISMMIMPREWVEAVMDLRDAGSAGHAEDRIGLITSALGRLEAIDENDMPPALSVSSPAAIGRLRVAVMRHETFASPVPDLPALAP